MLARPIRAADTEASGNEAQLTEIVVSAQRRTENLQSVPISAQVVGGAALTEQNLNSLVDVSQTMPAVHVSNGAASGDMYIRGIGSGTSNRSISPSAPSSTISTMAGRA